jgi:integrase
MAGPAGEPTQYRPLPVAGRAAGLPEGTEERAHFGDSYQGDFSFCNPDGSPLKPDTVSASVSLLFRNLKLPKGAGLHTLRHTHGSHLAAAGVPLADVSKRPGHTNPHVTATVCAHTLPMTTVLHGGRERQSDSVLAVIDFN